MNEKAPHAQRHQNKTILLYFGRLGQAYIHVVVGKQFSLTLEMPLPVDGKSGVIGFCDGTHPDYYTLHRVVHKQCRQATDFEYGVLHGPVNDMGALCFVAVVMMEGGKVPWERITEGPEVDDAKLQGRWDATNTRLSYMKTNGHASERWKC
jgi:hypothetical protein